MATIVLLTLAAAAALAALATLAATRKASPAPVLLPIERTPRRGRRNR